MAQKPAALVILGTRPEAIKLAPVVRALRAMRAFRVTVCATAQHRGLLDRALRSLQLAPDIDLDLMRPGQSPASFLPTALDALRTVIDQTAPAVVIVQGDTATAFAGALAAFYARVPVAHVEAGLRTDDIAAPFPEEGQRRLVSQLATFHFAPTEGARSTLIREGVPRPQILVTGNPGIDSLLATERLLKTSVEWRSRLRRRFAFLETGLPILFATVHRRENLGKALTGVATGLRLLAARREAEIVVAVHPNPDVAAPLRSALADTPHVHLVDPLSYPECVWLMKRARLVLTDSGGLQEEAATLGVPQLVLRDSTERTEGVTAGVAALVGSDPIKIAGTALAVIRDPCVHAWMARPMPLYGRGDSGPLIARALVERYGASRSEATLQAAA